MIETQDNKQTQLSQPQQQQLLSAETRIAPTWPLDQLIAVNPFWGMRDLPFDAVVNKMSALSQVRMLMPVAFYLEQWQQEAISEQALQQSAAHYAVDRSTNALLNWLKKVTAASCHTGIH